MKLIPVLLAAALVSACGAPGASDSGIRGRAVLWPACPVEPCAVPELPYEGSFVVRQDDDVVATVRTDTDGRFVVDLDPGRYVLQSEFDAEALPLLKPVDVSVGEHRFTEVTLRFDSGIR